jgi:hypothetical protein
MKGNGRLILIATAALSAVLGIIGCRAPHKSLVDSGIVDLQKQGHGKIHVVWSDAYEDKTGFVVTGVVRRYDRVGLPIKTHVNVAILSPEGTLLNENRSPPMYVPRSITGKGQSPQRFAVHFANTPPHGSLIRVTAEGHSSRDQ